MEQQALQRDWAELNQDVLMVIFTMVGVIDVLKNVEFVCRAWRNVTKDEPEIWRRIDMTGHGLDYDDDASLSDHEYDYIDKILMDQTKLAIDRSKGTVEEFWIREFADDDLLKYLCDRTNALKSLQLIMCTAISEEVLVDTVKAQPLLEDLHLIGNGITNMNLKEILEGCPRLKTLDIRACLNVSVDNDMRARCSGLETLRLPEDSLDEYELLSEVNDIDDYCEYCDEPVYYDYESEPDYHGDGYTQ